MNKDFNVAKFIIAHDVTSLEILWHFVNINIAQTGQNNISMKNA